MVADGLAQKRVRVDGKFFRLGDRKFFVKGVAYGPFAPNAQQQLFAAEAQTAKDFKQIVSLGANLVRVYQVPPRWFLDLASAHEIKVFIDILWNKERCFLDSENAREDAREAVRKAATACCGHPAVFAYSLVNEIPADIVRWSGAQAISDFIDELADIARQIDPGCLCTFGNFPPTEFLRPRTIDFLSFNIYLHQQRTYENYCARLQMIAGEKPLLTGEFGIDSLREGESTKCEILAWQIETSFKAGLAGTIVFTFTDDWFSGGAAIEDWFMGITSRDRTPKQSFFTVQKAFHAAPYFPLPRVPKVSIVVACFNGAKT
ncbi:MAG TPA: hypothetical protein VMZ27_15200, partial [Candidatus Saccharimonadales bacterium]|nr:hypothetical protein [Candidatus Saccharimonadales bacterium]